MTVYIDVSWVVLIVLLFGIAFGFVNGWFLFRKKIQPAAEGARRALIQELTDGLRRPVPVHEAMVIRADKGNESAVEDLNLTWSRVRTTLALLKALGFSVDVGRRLESRGDFCDLCTGHRPGAV